ncbi:MAG: FHA domain-containing protein [Gammaproteobacteria bacterium]|nr:FHA domain-containing protein [Gammaproteobacteria bacterium]
MPGKLEFSFNSNRLGDFVLDKEVMTIGRKDGNDIRIDNLAVSGHHAKLLTIFDDSFLEDLNSTNGTYVNGRPITKHPLKNGDVIVIGKHELRYLNESNSASDDDKTVLIRRQPRMNISPAPDLNTPIDMPGSIAANLNGAKLQILNGKGAGKELALRKSSVKLGKSGAEIVQINKRPDGHFIVSLDAENESSLLMINGETVGSRAVKLNNHDVIEINKLKIEYYLSI